MRIIFSSGTILKNNMSFPAFQIFLDQFTEEQNGDDIIRTQIIEQITLLPDW